MIRILFLLLVTIHGLIHLMGYVSAFKLAKIEQMTGKTLYPLTDSMVMGVGLLWLITAVVFLLTGLLYLIKKEEWWMVAVPAVIFSQLLIVLYWQDAKFGTIANIIIIVVMLGAYGAWQFGQFTRHELSLFLPQKTLAAQAITDDQLAKLPAVVQKWLRHSNVVGTPAAQYVFLRQEGAMRTKQDGKWMSFSARQWFTPKQAGFIWLVRVAMGAGMYMSGRDKYHLGQGHMLIKLFSLIPVVNAKGPTIDQGSMLRYLAEIVWFPSAALEPYIRWEPVDENSARATMAYGSIIASGIFRFTEEGDVKSFETKRYYDRKEGATLEDWWIENDPQAYQSLGGIRIPTRSEVTWKLASGSFTWLKLSVSEVIRKPERG